ncbi:MAG: hypothetical protein RIC16_02680 [Rhodospirillales bacterium]
MKKLVSMLIVAAACAGNVAHAADRPVETAQATSAPVRIEVLSHCRNDDAVFTIRNHGESWPASARFVVLRTVDDRVIKMRQTKILAGDEADIVIRGVAKTGVEVALRIDATWAAFSDEPVSRVHCASQG